MPKSKPNTLSILKHEIHEYLDKHRSGLTKQDIFEHFVSPNIDDETKQSRKWKINAALISLEYDKNLTVQQYKEHNYYYAK